MLSDMPSATQNGSKKAPKDLAEFLDRANLTQRDGARLLGISEAYLSQILNGKRTPRLKLALRLAEITNTPIDAFLKRAAKAQKLAVREDSGK